MPQPLDYFQSCSRRSCPNPSVIDNVLDISVKNTIDELNFVTEFIQSCVQCRDYYHKRWKPIREVFINNRWKRYWSPADFMTFLEMPENEYKKLLNTNRIEVFHIEGKTLIDMSSIYLHKRYYNRLTWFDEYREFWK